MRTISVLNFKGGTGKSSLTENLSHALAKQGAHVLVVDCDRQGNSSTTLLEERKAPNLTNVVCEEVPINLAIYQGRERLRVIPAGGDLDRASRYLSMTPEALIGLADQVSGLADLTNHCYDFVLFDHAGAYTPVMQAALLASDEMLIPCELEPYATSGLLSMFDKLKQVLRKHRIQNAGIIPYNVDMRYSMAHLYLEELRKSFGGLITAPIRTDSSVPRAQSMRQTVFEYDERCRAADDFRALATALLENFSYA